MTQKFKNVSKGDIGFGGNLTVHPGDTIELDDKLVEQKKEAIENLVNSDALEKVTGTSPKEKPKEEKPEEKPAKKQEEE